CAGQLVCPYRFDVW
nr:immunoglobulin heavy chain junction region [Macaca mulatta]